MIQKLNWLAKPFQNQAVSTETRFESAVWLEFSKNHFTLVTLEQIWRSYIFCSQMALQSVIKIDHTLSISIWVVDQSLAHDQQKVIKRSNRSRSAIDHHKSDLEHISLNKKKVIESFSFDVYSCILKNKIDKICFFHWPCLWDTRNLKLRSLACSIAFQYILKHGVTAVFRQVIVSNSFHWYRLKNKLFQNFKLKYLQ